MQNNYSFNYCIAPCKGISLNFLCFIYGINSLLPFLIALSKVIALPTIARAILVALSHS